MRQNRYAMTYKISDTSRRVSQISSLSICSDLLQSPTPYIVIHRTRLTPKISDVFARSHPHKNTSPDLGRAAIPRKQTPFKFSRSARESSRAPGRLSIDGYMCVHSCIVLYMVAR